MKNIFEKLGITPGPWVFSMGFCGAEKRPFVSCDRQTMDGMRIHNGKTLEEQANNARLISAAPEMLEMLIRSAAFELTVVARKIRKEIVTIEDAEKLYSPDPDAELALKDLVDKIIVIEKATGKPWKEIKGLLEEE